MKKKEPIMAKEAALAFILIAFLAVLVAAVVQHSQILTSTGSTLQETVTGSILPSYPLINE